MRQKADDTDPDGRFATCESCGRGIMPGERYHGGGDTDQCSDCAPTYQYMLDDPAGFIDLATEEHLTAEQAQEFCDAHVEAGGQLSDKILHSVAPGSVQ